MGVVMLQPVSSLYLWHTIEDHMLKSRTIRSLLCGMLAATGLLATLQTAEAGAMRVRFTPPFDTPFPDLEWGGVVDIDDGNCTATGSVSNLAGTCAGQFTILGGTLELSSLSNPADKQSIALAPSSSQVWSVDRTGRLPADYSGVLASPFDPVQGTIEAAEYSGSGDGGWFSVFLMGGNNVQLYWFDKNPGSYFGSPALYAQCGKSGDNIVGDYRCGTSKNTAVATFEPVSIPEPGTYAMVLAGLGALAFVGRRRRHG